MPTKVGPSQNMENTEDAGSEEKASSKPVVRFLELEPFKLKKIQQRFANYDFEANRDKRQSIDGAMKSLRVVKDSEEDFNNPNHVDLSNASLDKDGNVTFLSRMKHWLEKMIRPWSNNPVALAHFRSSHSMRKEQLRQRLTNRFIIHPYSLFRVIWDVLMIIVLFATMLVLPIEVAFYSANLWDDTWKYFNLTIDAIFVLDIFINMRTGYVINLIDQVVLDGKEIVKNYLKSWFAVDVISSLPIDYIVLGATGDLEGQEVLATTLRALRMVKFLSLLRILRFIRLIRYLGRMKEFMHIDAKILSILRLVMAILVFAHWNGCIQYLIVFIQGIPENSWLVLANLHHENVTKWSIYSHAVYRGMSHMISIGYGKTAPETNSETWTVVISMMMGATFYAMFIANVSAIVMSLDASGRHFQEKVCEVKDYMRFRRLPAGIQQRVIDYYEYKYQQKYFDEHEILDERHMSYPLRKEILMHNCRALVQCVPFLRESPSEFLVDVILKLTMHVYFPGDLIIQSGKKGDSMYFVEHGMVNVILGDGTVVNTLRDGAHFGEVSLLLDDKRIADVAAVETSYIYRLNKTDFDEVLADYPDMREEMMKVAQKRMQQTQAKLGSANSSAEKEMNEEESSEAVIGVYEVVEEENLNRNNINNNINNSNTTDGENGPNLDTSNTSDVWEDSGTTYMDCSSGGLGPMIMRILDEDEETTASALSDVLITYGINKKKLSKIASRESPDPVGSETNDEDEVYEGEKPNLLLSGIRRRHVNPDSNLPDASI